jgi:kinesin family protein 3/17
VRIRPLSTKEKQDGRTYIVTARPAEGVISLSNPDADEREPPKNFTFDASFGPESEQVDVYKHAARDIVDSVVDGFNGTIFAYGQTGAGKSHTMEGYNDPPELRGIIPNSFKHIFDKIGSIAKSQFMVCASYLEIYNEEIRDLLGADAQNRLELKENMDTGVYVKDLISRQVMDVAEIDAVMQQGRAPILNNKCIYVYMYKYIDRYIDIHCRPLTYALMMIQARKIAPLVRRS